MSKKILSGVLAAASMLTLSATAFAGDPPATPTTGDYKDLQVPGTGVTYTVDAKVDYGSVDVTLPTKITGVIINPYGAAVKTTVGSKSYASKSAIASEIYEIKNNDSTDGIKVMATASVTKAAGVVVKDMSLDETSVKGYSTDPLKGVTAGCPALDDFDPLVDYTAITLVAKKEDPSAPTKVTGQEIKAGTGIIAPVQKKNICVRLIGSPESAENAVAKWTTTGTGDDAVRTRSIDPACKTIDLLPKGAVTGELGQVEKGKSVYFSIDGEMNPELPLDTAWTQTDSLSLSIILKVLPVVAD